MSLATSVCLKMNALAGATVSYEASRINRIAPLEMADEKKGRPRRVGPSRSSSRDCWTEGGRSLKTHVSWYPRMSSRLSPTYS